MGSTRSGEMTPIGVFGGGHIGGPLIVKSLVITGLLRRLAFRYTRIEVVYRTWLQTLLSIFMLLHFAQLCLIGLTLDMYCVWDFFHWI